MTRHAKDPGFAAAMKMLRLRSGKSLMELQADVGVSAQAMSRWETAAASWPEERIARYLKAVGASEADLDREIYSVSEDPFASRFQRQVPLLQGFPADLERHMVSDESMSPWCEPGEHVYFQRGAHPKRLQGAVIDMHDGTTLIRLYERERDGFVFFRRMNPESTEQVLQAMITGIHRIVLRGD